MKIAKFSKAKKIKNVKKFDYSLLDDRLKEVFSVDYQAEIAKAFFIDGYKNCHPEDCLSIAKASRRFLIRYNRWNSKYEDIYESIKSLSKNCF